mgnify:CR=1 FL=1
MYAKTEKFDRLENEYRRIPIDNYVLLYTVNKKRNTVYIVHFYYGGRNYLEGLIWHVFIKNERKKYIPFCKSIAYENKSIIRENIEDYLKTRENRNRQKQHS